MSDLGPLGVLRLIRGSSLPATRRHVLAAYVLRADNEDRTTWVTAWRIAEDTGLAERSVRIHRKALLQDGILVQVRAGSHPLYRIDPEAIPSRPAGGAAQPAVDSGPDRQEDPPERQEVPVNVSDDDDQTGRRCRSRPAVDSGRPAGGSARPESPATNLPMIYTHDLPTDLPTLDTRTARALSEAGHDPGHIHSMPRSACAKLPGIGPAAMARLDAWLEAMGKSWAPEPKRASRTPLDPRTKPLTDIWARLYTERYGEKYPWTLNPGGLDRKLVNQWPDACRDDAEKFERAVLAYFEEVDAGRAWPKGDPPLVRHFTRDVGKWLASKRSPGGTKEAGRETLDEWLAGFGPAEDDNVIDVEFAHAKP